VSSTSDSENRAALDLLQAATRKVADQAKPPAWYHVTLGLLVGGLAAIQEAPIVWRFAYEAAALASMFLLVRAKKRHTGLWIPGYRAGRTRWVAAGVGSLFVAIFLLSAWARFDLHLQGVFLVAGALIAVLTTAAGYIWHWAYRLDLAEGRG